MGRRGPSLAVAILLGVVAALLVGGLAVVAWRTPAPAAEPQVSFPILATGLPELALTPAVQAPPTAAPTPTTQPTTEPPAGQLVIRSTGDVNLDPGSLPALASQGYEFAWSGLDGLFTEDDLTIINLECTPSELGAAVPKEFNFRCPPASLPAAAAAGVEVANLGNNHAGDYGPDALVDGGAQVRLAGMHPVGAGANAAEATTPAVLDIDGWRVAVLGFGGVVPTPDWIATADHPGMADGDDIPTMVAAVTAASELADLVVVAIHWGAELDTQPRAEDVERAHAMIDAGADAIFGHHAHRLQPLGWYRGRPIAWGLGNFVWGAHSEPGRTTAVAEVVVEPDGSIGACLRDAWIESEAHPVLREPVAELCTATGAGAAPPGGTSPA